MSRKTALYIFIALISLPAISLYAEQPNIELISVDPASPAVLEPGQRLYVKFRYNAGDAEAIRTWVRPEPGTKGCKSHPCSPIKDKEGVYEGWFFFEDNAAEIKSVKIAMKDCKDRQGYICEKSVPVDIKWKAPSDKWPRGYAVPNTDLQVISTDPVVPAGLKPGEEFKIKFRFDAGNAKSIKIMSWPNNANRCFPSGKTYTFNNIDRSVGVYEYSLRKNKTDRVEQVKIRIVNAETERVILEYTYPTDIRWGEGKAAGSQIVTISETACKTDTCRKTPVSPKTTSGQFDLMHLQIAKKHAKKYEGLWAFETKGAGKEDRVIILKSKTNKTGGLEFSFIHTGNSSKSVFVKSSVDQYRVNAYFKFKGKPIMYSLAREGELLNGTVYSLKKEAKISLQKLTLSQAVDAIESDLSRIASLEEEVKKVRTEAEKQKARFLVQTKEFQKHIGEFTKQTQELKQENKKLRQQYRDLIEKNKKEVQEMRTKCVKLTAQLENAKKENHESEKQSNTKIALLRVVISELRIQRKAAAQEIHELQAANEKLRQGNQAYKEQARAEIKAAFKKYRKLQTENEKLRQSNHAYKERVQAELKAAAKKNRKLQTENKKLRKINQALKEQNNKAGQPKEGSAQENEKPAGVGVSN